MTGRYRPHLSLREGLEQPSFYLPKIPARATALPSIVRCGGPAVVFAAEEFFYAGCFLKSLPSTGI